MKKENKVEEKKADIPIDSTVSKDQIIEQKRMKN